MAFQKGHKLSKGRPTQSVEQKTIKEVTIQDYAREAYKGLYLTQAKLKEIAKSDDSLGIETIIAKAILFSGRKNDLLLDIFNRLWGKSKDRLEVINNATNDEYVDNLHKLVSKLIVNERVINKPGREADSSDTNGDQASSADESKRSADKDGKGLI